MCTTVACDRQEVPLVVFAHALLLSKSTRSTDDDPEL